MTEQRLGSAKGGQLVAFIRYGMMLRYVANKKIDITGLN